MQLLVELVACVGCDSYGERAGGGYVELEVGFVLEELAVAQDGAGAADGGRRGYDDGGGFRGGEGDVVSG